MATKRSAQGTAKSRRATTPPDRHSSFDERARDWDTPERRDRVDAVAEAIRASVKLAPTMRAIDLGAGTGLLGLSLASDVGEMVLAEPSKGMLEVAREKLAAGGPANVTAVRFDLEVDPPPLDPFDLAVSLLVLHHLADTNSALSAIRRLLRPGGRIAMADLDAEDGSFHDPDAEGIHHLGFERPELIAMTRAAGFVDVEIRTAPEIERDGRRYPLFLLLAQRR
jgi:ubiquinone/menaquinone biosynthesis C-methylase UbiE